MKVLFLFSALTLIPFLSFSQNKIDTVTKATCGSSFAINHTAGEIAPITKTVRYSTAEVHLPGYRKCWITQNLGADHPANSPYDSSEASSGWYWQFNRKQGYTTDGFNILPDIQWISSIDENSDWQVANDPCTLLLGNEWRLPTYVDWKLADDAGYWDNSKNAFYGTLQLHAAGQLFFKDGSLILRGSWGTYWSSIQADNTNGWRLDFYNDGCLVDMLNKSFGHTIRCIKDL